MNRQRSKTNTLVILQICEIEPIDVGNNQESFIPLWMRTSAVAGEGELGFVLAVRLCYCKPGQ